MIRLWLQTELKNDSTFGIAIILLNNKDVLSQETHFIHKFAD